MFCDTCSKLAILNTNKTCMNCKGAVYNNISVLCEQCSASTRKCSSCLKNIYKGFENPNYKHLKSGCKSCG